MSKIGGFAQRGGRPCLEIISGIPILVVHQDGAKHPHQPAIPRQGGFLRTEDVADRQPRGFLVTTRRKFLFDISVAAASAPAIVGVGSLMSIRGVVMPLRKNYYGFCDRLWIKRRYESGELRGRALRWMIEEGILQVPPAVLAYGLARWGTRDLSLVAREERREALWPV